jgi:hypothetical protein
MKLQKPKIDARDLPAECINVFNLLNKNWYKHNSSKCHEETFHYWNFCHNNKECLEHLSKEQVIQLFGQPDVVDCMNCIGYIIKESCKDESMLHYHKLNFFFTEQGNQVEISNVEGTEN